MTKLFFIILILTVLIIGVVLGVLNPNVVVFDAFFAIYEIPLSILLASSLVLGMILGASLMLSKIISLKWCLKKVDRKVKTESDQIIQLKKEVTLLNQRLIKDTSKLKQVPQSESSNIIVKS